MILYLDTSSLLKLYVEEEGTAEVQDRVRAADAVATSVIAYPEAHAALARRRREGALTRSEFTAALDRFRDSWSRLLAILVSVPVATRAGALAVKHGLRGMDAIHLASYVEVRARGEAVQFLSHDGELMDAAAREGYTRQR